MDDDPAGDAAGSYLIQNEHSALCASVAAGRGTNAQAGQTACDNTDPTRWTISYHDAITDVLAAFPPFDFTLTEVRQFASGVIYLVPEPPKPFVAITEALTDRWPEHPATPQVSIEFEVADRDALDAAAAELAAAGHDLLHPPREEPWGQTVARLVYEPLTARPSLLYGDQGSHYQRQGLKLSKHFQRWTANG